MCGLLLHTHASPPPSQFPCVAQAVLDLFNEPELELELELELPLSPECWGQRPPLPPTRLTHAFFIIQRPLL